MSAITLPLKVAQPTLLRAHQMKSASVNPLIIYEFVMLMAGSRITPPGIGIFR